MTDLCNRCHKRPKVKGLGWCRHYFHSVDPELAERAGVHVMGEKMLKKVKPLTKAQQKLLDQLKLEEVRLCGARHRPSRTLQILIERGLVVRIPGLLGDEIPQGYAPAQ